MEAAQIRIAAVGTALPDPPIDNAALARRFGMNQLWEQWVDGFIGTRTRHLAVDLETGRQRFRLADLAETAARKAMESASVDALDVDVLVMSTATPDQLMPTTCNVVADRLGIDGIPTYQIQSGCSGAVQSLELASTILRGGQCRTALVVGGDVCAKYWDADAELKKMPPGEMVNRVLFGDGAGAAVLTTEPLAGAPVLRATTTRLVGLGRAPGQILEWFGIADRDGRAPVVEDYKAIEELIPAMAGEVLDELLDQLDWPLDDLDFILPPQLSGRMTERIVGQLPPMSAHRVNCVAETGNIGNGLPYLQLERLVDEIDPGHRAIGIAVESSKWISAGYAVEGS